MKRTYEVTITLRCEQTFHRKRRGVLVKQEALRGIEAPPGWGVVGARVRSRMISEPRPTPGPSEEKRAQNAAVARAQAVLEELRRGNLRVPVAAIRWYTAGCGSRGRGYGAHIHAHHRPVKRVPGTKTRITRYIRMPRNLICLNNLPLWFKADDSWIAHTIAHELAHAVFARSRQGHRAAAFNRKVREYHDAWKAYRAGAPLPMVASPIASGTEIGQRGAALEVDDIGGLEVYTSPPLKPLDHNGV